MPRTNLPIAALCMAALACSTTPGPDSGSTPDAGDAGAPLDGGIAGIGLLSRLAGLWVGQAGQTPLGSFPELFMEFRAADGHWLFGRTDLDGENNLRYGFAVENIAGTPTLVFRNGGYFQGTLRDLTTQLVDFDESAGTYHFCAADQLCLYVNGSCIPETGGCGFVDALFTFSAPDQLVFNAHVNGMEHEIWTASRKSTSALPSPFPSDPTSLQGDAGWPDLPQLSVTVSWATALASPTSAWVILSDSPCGATFSCTPSRSFVATADAGATSVTVLFDQIHAGSYDANALLDVAGDFQVTLVPASGDLVNYPEDQSVTVPASGVGTASLVTNVAVP